MRVKLTTDLTRYDRRLTVGSLGYTTYPLSTWARCYDRFTGVEFDNGAALDVLWEGLEIIDEVYLARVSEYKKQLEIDLKSAYNIEKVIGPRGGFRHISFQYYQSDGTAVSHSIGFKEQAEEYLDIFRKHGLKWSTRTVD